MSVFVEQNYTICDFQTNESWVVLSPIEQSIKSKIESVGTPLKDWDIQINYGIKTGYNEAFIISTEKREEILANCQSAEEKQRTAELIRPILRGRDIKRYGYEWANLWLIATFPSRHYNIENFLSLKEYLLSYGIERLEQTGTNHIVNGNMVKSRKKTNNQWFETQDSISYWEDFSKPKIIWKRIGSIVRFGYSGNDMMGLDSSCFATGRNIEYICCLLNSPMGHYLLKDSPKTGTGDLLISVQAVNPIRIPSISIEADKRFYQALYLLNMNNSAELEEKINNMIFRLYNLSDQESQYIKDNFS